MDHRFRLLQEQESFKAQPLKVKAVRQMQSCRQFSMRSCLARNQFSSKFLNFENSQETSPV